MRLAILGATSHIAKDLVQSFAAQSTHELVLYARCPNVVTQWLNRIGFAERYAVADFAAFTTDEHFDGILNFVGVGDPAQAAAMGAAIFDVTFKYDELALNYVRKNPDCRYIFLSSGAAYGVNFDEPVDENTKAVIAINNPQLQDWYAVAKLHAECRHRAMANLPIIDLRVFNYFSHTQDIEARFLITDILRAVRDKTSLQTSPENIVRDYIHPDDFFQLVNMVLAAPLANMALDCYSKEPIDKNTLLSSMQHHYDLKYKTEKKSSKNMTIGIKRNYYSLRKSTYLIGYSPIFTSLEGLIHEAGKMMSLWCKNK